MHCMQHSLAMVKLSVRPSVCQTRDLWQNKRNVCPDFYKALKNVYPSFANMKNG